MNLKDRIDEVLEHYDYCLVSKTGTTTDNIIQVETPTKIRFMFYALTIMFGAERVSMVRGQVKVTL